MSTQRPYLICHMMSSLDGKITSGTGQDIFDDEYLPLYEETDDKQQAQGWICGTVTMEMFAEEVDTPIPTREASYQDYKNENILNQFAVAIDVKGRLRWKSNVITSSLAQHKQYSLIVIVTKQTPSSYLAYLQTKQISYLIAGERQLDWNQALEKLSTLFNIQKLSLQGGGKINGSLLKAGFIDELSLLVIPFAVNNSQAPAVFENTVTAESFKTYGFSLYEVKKLEKDVVWLRYKNSSLVG